ncbi:MAG: phosphonate C-P lyase system protein PhnH [Actinomycetota bacterium]
MPAADQLASARLSGSRSLDVFRVLLDAAARPGTVGRLPLYDASVPPALYPALALADLDHVVGVLDVAGNHWSALLRHATGARVTNSVATPDGHQCDIAVALRPPSPSEIEAMRRGTPEAPELGARLVVAVRTLSPEPIHLAQAAPRDAPAASFSLHGPGAARPRVVQAVGAGPDVLHAIATANRDFPAGIDTWIVADNGSVVAVPRSARIDVLADHRPRSTASLDPSTEQPMEH